MEISLKEIVEQFLEQAKTSDLTVGGRYPHTYMGLKVLVSFGKGNVAKVPWIAFLSPGQKVSEGIYPIILFYKSEQLLVLAYGVSEINKPSRLWNQVDSPTIETYARTTGLKIDKYRTSFFHSSYDVSSPIKWELLSKSLEEVIQTYSRSMSQ